MHRTIRHDVCEYLRSHREKFGYVAENFDEYVNLRELDGTWGDNPEIIAIEELFDRRVDIYTPRDGYEPRKTHFVFPTHLMGDVTPIRLHYQGNNHYNSIIVERDNSNRPRDRETFPLSSLRSDGIIRRYREEQLKQQSTTGSSTSTKIAEQVDEEDTSGISNQTDNESIDEERSDDSTRQKWTPGEDDDEGRYVPYYVPIENENGEDNADDPFAYEIILVKKENGEDDDEDDFVVLSRESD